MNPGTVCIGYLDPDEWSACFGLSMRDLLLCDATVGKQRIVPNGRELRQFCASGGISAGRNNIAAKFLDTTDCEWLWFIDSDMGFGPTTVEDLIASADPKEAPVVGGLCFSIKQEGHGPFYSVITDIFPTIYDWRETESRIGFTARVDYERDAMVQADATGAACLLIHRTVLETIREKWGDHWFDLIPHPKAEHKALSEDLSFCMRLAAAGIPLWINTAVKTVHHKGQGHFLSEGSFDRQVMAVQAEAERFFAGWVALWHSTPARKPITTANHPRLVPMKPVRVA